MYEIHFTEEAESDLIKTLTYIRDVLKAPAAASALLQNIEERLDYLRGFPLSCPIIQDDYLSSKGLRLQIIENYIAFYVIHENSTTISIIRFLYARRDWKTILALPAE